MPQRENQLVGPGKGWEVWVAHSLSPDNGDRGCVQAALLSEQYKLKVVMVDPNLDKRWLPNYGVWLEEWEGQSVLLVSQAPLEMMRDNSSPCLWWLHRHVSSGEEPGFQRDPLPDEGLGID